MLTITGGKWTTYREMAEDAINQSVQIAGLPVKPCVTRNLKVHGYAENVDMSKWDYVYGSDISKINLLEKECSENADLLHKDFTFTVAHVIWAVREEMAQSVEDVLARRVRLLFLDARAAIEIAPRVAAIMAKSWIKLMNG